MRLRSAFVAAVCALLLLVGCKKLFGIQGLRNVDAGHRVALASDAAPAVPTTSIAPVLEATRDAEAAAASAPTARGRDETPSSVGRLTPGEIRCGDTPCSVATSFCYEEPGGKKPLCRPRGDWATRAGTSRACDDVLDCGTGKKCCSEQAGGAGWFAFQCVAESEVCHLGEACTNEAVCAPGFRCERRGNEAGCAPAMALVACGRETCSSDRPACCWDAAKNEGACVAAPTVAGADGARAVCPEGRLLRCRTRADCAGYFCCDHAEQGKNGGTSCGGRCPTVEHCETNADCRAGWHCDDTHYCVQGVGRR